MNILWIIFIVCAVISRCFCMHCFCIALLWRRKQCASLQPVNFSWSMEHCFLSRLTRSAPRSRICTEHWMPESLQSTLLYLRCFYEVFFCLVCHAAWSGHHVYIIIKWYIIKFLNHHNWHGIFISIMCDVTSDYFWNHIAMMSI